MQECDEKATWLRGQDLNLRPSGYEPDELPGCSTPRHGEVMRKFSDLCGPGGDLLSRVLRRSTIGAEAFDGRVRDGIGSYRLAEGHQAGEEQLSRRLSCEIEAKLGFSGGCWKHPFSDFETQSSRTGD